MNNTKPNINVTPLIDVLLVLLIIFMVITPIKPTDFKTKIPQEAKQTGGTNPKTLIVTLSSDSSLKLNKENELGTAAEPEKLITRLTQVFKERTENLVYADNTDSGKGLTQNESIEKTVFIQAPRSLDYGSVAKVIDAVKISGAYPISLQIDDLE